MSLRKQFVFGLELRKRANVFPFPPSCLRSHSRRTTNKSSRSFRAFDFTPKFINSINQIVFGSRLFSACVSREMRSEMRKNLSDQWANYAATFFASRSPLSHFIREQSEQCEMSNCRLNLLLPSLILMKNIT